jgi:hypothetical protein
VSKFDLTPSEQAVWQEFRYSTKAIIAEFLILREQAAGIENNPEASPKATHERMD